MDARIFLNVEPANRLQGCRRILIDETLKQVEISIRLPNNDLKQAGLADRAKSFRGEAERAKKLFILLVGVTPIRSLKACFLDDLENELGREKSK
jgi:hypothetical protein